mmetsp:Transcript_1277/g.3305  ORF Transcript_1277/g.3305 Transcript_1277/m.3305 type:complete len:341 (+) Transcript_1277:68-1090(+)
MSSIAATSCNVPVCDVDELARAHLASDESTEADSGAEESPPGPRVAAGRSPTAGTAASRAASLAAAGARPGAAASASWQLIWCHERCHKKECETRKNIFIKDAEEYKASLLCLKKAAKYAAWLEQAPRSPYALLTDWREVKPCLEAAALHPPRNQPAFTVILCDIPKHYERASAWAQSLPARHDPVRVCRDMGLLKGLLQELAGQLLRSRTAMLRGPPGQFNSVAKPFPMYGATQATGYGIAPWTADADDDRDKEFEAIRKQRDSMWLRPAQTVPCLMSAWGATVSSPLVAHTMVGVEQCGYVVQCVAAPQSPLPHADQAEGPQLLEAMLVNAMPDHYDD